MKVKLCTLASSTALLVLGGEFRTLLSTQPFTVSVATPRPPDFILTVKKLSLKSGQSSAPPNRLLQLTQLIQQNLSHQFDISEINSEATLQFSVISYEPIKISNESVLEMRNINVGNEQKPNYRDRSVPVVYQLTHGAATVGGSVIGRTGSVLDTFQYEEVVARRKELTVNRQASTLGEVNNEVQTQIKSPLNLGGIIIPPGLYLGQIGRPPVKVRTEMPRKIVETPDSIEFTLLQALATKIQRRYVATSQPFEIALAVDRELQLGNKLAQSGQWKEALDFWTKANLRRNPSDRLYNLAVAREALAYADYSKDSDLSALLPKFEEAMKLYTEALHGDPNEKYMRESVDRINLAKSNIEAARNQEIDQKQKTEVAIAGAAAAVQREKLLDAALKDLRLDTPPEASFRENVRTQLAEVNGPVSEERKSQLLSFGGRLKLTEIQSWRVVGQEIDHHTQISAALVDYENSFRPLAADGRITPTERNQLSKLAQTEGLTPEDLKVVESKYRFLESSSPSPRITRSVGQTAGVNR